MRAVIQARGGGVKAWSLAASMLWMSTERDFTCSSAWLRASASVGVARPLAMNSMKLWTRVSAHSAIAGRRSLPRDPLREQPLPRLVLFHGPSCRWVGPSDHDGHRRVRTSFATFYIAPAMLGDAGAAGHAGGAESACVWPARACAGAALAAGIVAGLAELRELLRANEAS